MDEAAAVKIHQLLCRYSGCLVGSADSGTLKHLRLELIQEDEPYRHISAIAFNLSDHFEHMQAGNPVDICYSIAENYYRGIANIQLRVRDIKDKTTLF